MGHRLKIPVRTVCEVCGCEYERTSTGRPHRCLACGIGAITTVAGQMRDGAGPFYERTVVKQLAHWTAEAVRLGIIPADPAS